ncbi:MAG: dockerin type I repeat-containing protein [Oscillospiraceae bacterium]|nr:dockerin type I repeat-containing protein [Oscillospiraceae bacterium]
MKSNFLKKAASVSLCTGIALSAAADMAVIKNDPVTTVSASAEMAHDASRDVQAEGVGNPFNYGERNTPENGTDEEIRAINHKMSVQEVKYCMYKEIDEHWDLIRVRFGQDNREMVYALFCGLGSRESTLGGNGDGADLETAHSEGFGVSSAHAYGTMQTAVTAFKDCDPTFMKEDDVPEMYQYTLTHANFYDAVISNHMGIRKLMHFVRSAIVDYNLEGYQVVRAALKAFNTGWANYTGEDDGYYKNYPDEIIALARWYYEEGHLYDNEFTWTTDKRADEYRQGNPWEWWGDGVPSLAEISTVPAPSPSPSPSPSPDPTSSPDPSPEPTTASPSPTASDPTAEPTPVSPTPTTTPDTGLLLGDVDENGRVDITDLTTLAIHLLDKTKLSDIAAKNADVDGDGNISLTDLATLRQYLSKKIDKLG